MKRPSLAEALAEAERSYDQAAELIVEQHGEKALENGMTAEEAALETASFAEAMLEQRPVGLGLLLAAIRRQYVENPDGQC